MTVCFDRSYGPGSRQLDWSDARATREAILERLMDRGWLISAGSLTDHLARLDKAGRIHRTGKTRATRWESTPKASNATPNGPESWAGHPPNEPPNTNQGAGIRAAGGAE